MRFWCETVSKKYVNGITNATLLWCDGRLIASGYPFEQKHAHTRYHI
jgi:hypothetical protein